MWAAISARSCERIRSARSVARFRPRRHQNGARTSARARIATTIVSIAVVERVERARERQDDQRRPGDQRDAEAAAVEIAQAVPLGVEVAVALAAPRARSASRRRSARQPGCCGPAPQERDPGRRRGRSRRRAPKRPNESSMTPSWSSRSKAPVAMRPRPAPRERRSTRRSSAAWSPLSSSARRCMRRPSGRAFRPARCRCCHRSSRRGRRRRR